jgi:hypothetical protein
MVLLVVVVLFLIVVVCVVFGAFERGHVLCCLV